MGPLGELGALFNPGMRHEIEERQSKANRREEEGNARDGDLRIDLASGVAVINVSKNGDQGSPEGRPAADGSASKSSRLESEASPPESGASPPESGASLPESAASLPAASDPPGSQHGHRSDAPADTREYADADVDEVSSAAPSAAPGDGRQLTAAQARRLATAARRSADGDRPARPVLPRPANTQQPSSKASRAAR